MYCWKALDRTPPRLVQAIPGPRGSQNRGNGALLAAFDHYAAAALL